jgi:tRNA G26 N,N-dimethylase Trm1
MWITLRSKVKINLVYIYVIAYICVTKANNMTTQTITSTLNAAGFKAFYTMTEKVNGINRPVRKGDFSSFKIGKMIGVETFGKNTSEMVAALVAKGLNAVETRPGSGMIKIL